MNCMVAIEESSRNVLMLLSWLPSVVLAAGVFTAISGIRRRRKPTAQPDVNGTLLALGGGAATLFTSWITLLVIGGRLICAAH